MQINLVYDPSVASAPAAFKPAVAYAAQALDSLITNNITVTITVGFGEDDGQPLSGFESTGGASTSYELSYAQLKADLTANVSSAADGIALANLPVTDPTNGDVFLLYPAQEKALGLLPANSTEIDGTVGFSSTYTHYNYDPNDRTNKSGSDFIGAAEHELAHAMGRVSAAQDGQGFDSVLDLFRYARPGVLATPATAAPYFSIDGGVTKLDAFDTLSDWADWAPSAGPDSFDATGQPGENPITPVDTTEMNVLGFSVAASPETTTSFNVSNEAALNSALAAVRFGAAGVNYTITLAAGIALNTALFAIDVPGGATLTIDGNAHTIDGGDQQGGLDVDTGNVILQGLTIAHAAAIGGTGARGAGGGGGGAGEGGGLFIGSGATVTMNGVTFLDDIAEGGAGGPAEQLNDGGDGGGLNGGSAILNGASLTAQSGGGPGANGGGGGGGASWFLSPASGTGGPGGWGGGGGGSGYAQTGAEAVGGPAGFGAGEGGDTAYIPNSYGYGGGGGGGGLGAGGDIFISNGGALVVANTTLTGGEAFGGQGGTGFDVFNKGPTGFGTGTPGTAGSAFGGGIFIQGNQQIVFAPASGQNVAIYDVIADQEGSGGIGANAASGGLIINGTGTVVLAAANTFTGGTTIENGTLEIGAGGSAGNGPIAFAGESATLRADAAGAPSNVISGFFLGDTIDLAGLRYTAGGAAVLNGKTNVLTVTEGGDSEQFTLSGAYTGDNFQVAPDAASGTAVTLTSASAGLANAYYIAILRTAPSEAVLQSYSAALTAGTLTAPRLLVQLLESAQATTIPALLSYDFMAGAAPASSGLDFLTSYAADLQSGNYTYDGGFVPGTSPGQYNTFQFSVLNTYVNFCATDVQILGNPFTAAYGSLAASAGVANRAAFFEDVYTRIFGVAPAAGTVALFVTSPSAADPAITTFQYYVNYAGSELGGYGAVAGVLLSVAETPPNQAGPYPTPVTSFLTQAATSSAAGSDTAPYGGSLLSVAGDNQAVASDIGGSGEAANVTSAAIASNATTDVISITQPDQLTDPGTGGFTIRFLPGSGADTLTLHTGGMDTVTGFDPASDVLDVRSLLAESHIDLNGDIAALSAFLTVTDRGADALLRFDPTALGGGSTVADLQGLGGTVTGLNSLLANRAITAV